MHIQNYTKHYKIPYFAGRLADAGGVGAGAGGVGDGGRGSGGRGLRQGGSGGVGLRRGGFGGVVLGLRVGAGVEVVGHGL